MSVERLEIKFHNPNLLIEKWIERWLKEAENRGSKSTFALREALQSIRSYPLPLESGTECGILRGFGTKLCQMINNELQMYKMAKLTTNTGPYQQEINELVETVQKTRKGKPKNNEKLKKNVQSSMDLEREPHKEIEMDAESFEILLLVDTQETSGKNKKSFDQTRSYLDSLAVKYEVRRLTVGDFLWIARDKQGNELVLPYMCERKRMDDLASSIRDGRFLEQKHRLAQCGIQNIIYLVEDYGTNQHIGLPIDNLYQAMANTQIQSGFQVVRTKNHWRSMVFLKSTSRTLINLFKGKSLVSAEKKNMEPFDPASDRVTLLEFKAFYNDSAKNALLNVQEVFIQQLLQLHSLSFEKATAIVELYPTPRCLIEAFQRAANENEARNLLTNVRVGAEHSKRPIGYKISSSLYECYCTSF